MSDIKDHLFGRLASLGHFVTEAQVEEAIAEQQLFEQTGQPVPPLGEVLVQKGYMTIEQVKAVLNGQNNRKAKFGEVTIQWKLCSQASVQAALAFQTECRARGDSAPRIGEILVTRGLIKAHQVHAILQTQGKAIVRCPHCKTRYNVMGLIPGASLDCGRCKKTFYAVAEEPLATGNGTTLELRSDLTQQAPAVTADDGETAPGKIGPYQILSRLGADHSGVLYKASDPGSQQAVVIRVLSEQIMRGTDDFERWVAAGQAASELNHPNLQRILTMGSENNHAYLVMEFIEGQSLRQRLRDRGGLPLLEALDILIQIAEALAYGHAHDLIHGDLHPRHVLVGQDRRVRLGNLGTPKKIMQDLRLMAQISGSLPLYAAPEVLIDEGEADERSDLYSLCALGYHLVTGKPPLEGRDLLQAGFMAASGSIVPAQNLVPALPSYVNRVLLKGLSSEPEGRYETADALLADLRKCRAGAMLLAPDVPDVAPLAERPAPPRRAIQTRQRVRTGDRRKGTYLVRQPKAGGSGRPVGNGGGRGGRASGIGSALQRSVTPMGMPSARTGSASKLQPAVPSSAPQVPAIGSGGIPATQVVQRRRLRGAMDSARLHFEDLSPFAKAMCLMLPVLLGGVITAAIWFLRPQPAPSGGEMFQPQDLQKSDNSETSVAERKARGAYNTVLDFAQRNPADHAGVVRQIDDFLARFGSLGPESKTLNDAKKLRADFAQAGVRFSLDPLRKKLEGATSAFQFREAQEELESWGKLWGDEVAGPTKKDLTTWLSDRKKHLAEELLAKIARLRSEKKWDDARVACQEIADHFGPDYASKASTERMKIDETERNSKIIASTEAEEERKKMLAEQREARAPEQYGRLLQELVPVMTRFDVEAALEAIDRDALEFASTAVGPKFQALKADMARLKALRERIVEAVRQGKLSDLKIEYHQEEQFLKDASATGPILIIRGGRVETRWQEFSLGVLSEIAARAIDAANGSQTFDLALYRLYTGQLKEAETTLAKADKLGVATQFQLEQLRERLKHAPIQSVTAKPVEAKEQEQDAAMVLALKALGYEIQQGVWSLSPERALSGVPTGKDPQTARLMSLRRSVPPFKSLSMEVRGESDVAGFSFGKGRRWTAPVSAEWQQFALKVDVTGRSLFTVNGAPKESADPLDLDAARNLGDVVYLRAVGKSVQFRNLAIDGQVLGGAGGAPVVKPLQDPAAAQALKLLGWEIAGGVWTIEGENHFRAVPDQAHLEVGVRREMANCRSISVELRGNGETAGFSFGQGKRFVVRPTDDWRKITLQINDKGRPKLLLNGQPIVSVEDASKAISADLTGTFGLRGVGSRIEFRNFQFE